MKHFTVFAVLAASAAWAQEQPTLRARELFYTPPPDAAKPASTAKAAAKKTASTKPVAAKQGDTHTLAATIPLGLRYAVLKRDAGGQYQEVDPDTSFRSGDRIRLKVDANTSGYLYVIMQGSSGTWKLLFPSTEVAGGSNLVRKGESRMIPSGERGQFVFDEQAGQEKLFIVLSRQPQPELDKLIYSVGDQKLLVAQAVVGDDVVSKMRGQVAARDLVFEKADSASPETGKAEVAAYVVNPSTSPDARLVVDIGLKHR